MRVDHSPSASAAAQKLVVASIVLAAAYLLKAYYSRADSEDLIWMIGPVARLVELFSHLNFIHEPGYGWVDVEHDVVIAPACAGVNFYIIAFCMSAFQLTRKTQPLVRTLAKIMIAGLLSYCVAILANVLRILLAAYFYEIQFHSSWVSPEAVHRIVGTCVFYLLLFCYFRAVSTWLNRQAPGSRSENRQLSTSGPVIFCLPLVWYLAFSLGVPLANQAFQADPQIFVRHALHVVGVTVALTLLCLVSHLLIIQYKKTWGRKIRSFCRHETRQISGEKITSPDSH